MSPVAQGNPVRLRGTASKRVGGALRNDDAAEIIVSSPLSKSAVCSLKPISNGPKGLRLSGRAPSGGEGGALPMWTSDLSSRRSLAMGWMCAELIG